MDERDVTSAPFRVFDLHCDTVDLLAMRDKEPYVSWGCAPGDDGFTNLASNSCAISLDRMEDYAWCQCFAVWVPDAYRGQDARDFYLRARDFFYDQTDQHENRIRRVRSASQIRAALADGLTAAVLTLENSTPLAGDLSVVDTLARDGVRMATLTWNAPNGHASGHESLDGLTPLGVKTVRAYEDAGITVDVSHLNDEGFWQFVDIARKPFVASHSNSRAVCDVPRNLTDDQFRAIRDAGGLVGINFYRKFLTTRELASDADEVTVEELFAHIEHFLDLGGTDTLALGSDWDGSDVPAWICRCDMAGDLRYKVCRRFGDAIAEKLFFSNAIDFFSRDETS